MSLVKTLLNPTELERIESARMSDTIAEVRDMSLRFVNEASLLIGVTGHEILGKFNDLLDNFQQDVNNVSKVITAIDQTEETDE